MIKKDLLWTNASPTSSFSSKTLTLGDLTPYAMIEIIVRYGTGTANYLSVTIWRFGDVQSKMVFDTPVNSNKRKSWRPYQLTWSTGDLWVGVGKYNDANSNGDLYPVSVYGVRGNTRSVA